MTQKERWVALLTESSVNFRETGVNEINTNATSRLVIESTEKPGCVNDGYSGFAVDLAFDATGNLIKFGIFE